MKYVRVVWHHDIPEEPVELLSEIDEEGWEVRKVEVFRDGRRDWASEAESTGSSMLSETKFPDLEYIASQSEFSPSVISQGDFEEEWNRAHNE
jgi:hypothetical protein